MLRERFIILLSFLGLLFSCQPIEQGGGKVPQEDPDPTPVIPTLQSISLDKSILRLRVGEAETLNAILSPAGVTENVTWESSDPGVATVLNGIVTAKGIGQASIVARAGSKSADCPVVVKWPIPEDAVDLGVWITRENGTKYKVYWRDRNLGADTPEGYGDYYAWGEVETHYTSLDPLIWKEGYEAGYSWDTYRWAKGAHNKLTKYCSVKKDDYWAGPGEPDDKNVLDTGPDGDDVASKLLGNGWAMPSDKELKELTKQCEWEWGSKNGIPGYYVKSKEKGNNNSIFLPCAGFIYDTVREIIAPIIGAGPQGGIWSSTIEYIYFYQDPSDASCIIFGDTGYSYTQYYRHAGMSVRPVFSD